MAVEADFAAWLRAESLNAVASDAQISALWGALAKTAELISPYASKADAAAEAERQLAIFGTPMVVEVLQVRGLRIDLFARPVRLRAARAGYQGGATVFVIGAKEAEAVEMTNLTVLRKLQ